MGNTAERQVENGHGNEKKRVRSRGQIASFNRYTYKTKGEL